MDIDTDLRMREEADQAARKWAAELESEEQRRREETDQGAARAAESDLEEQRIAKELEEMKSKWWEALVAEYGYESSEQMALSALRYAVGVLREKDASEFFGMERKTVRTALERGRLSERMQRRVRDRCAVPPLTRRQPTTANPFSRLEWVEEKLREIGRPRDLLGRLAQLEAGFDGLRWQNGDTEQAIQIQSRLRAVERDVAALKKSGRNAGTDPVEGTKVRQMEGEMKRMAEQIAILDIWVKLLAGIKGEEYNLGE